MCVVLIKLSPYHEKERERERENDGGGKKGRGRPKSDSVIGARARVLCQLYKEKKTRHKMSGDKHTYVRTYVKEGREKERQEIKKTD